MATASQPSSLLFTPPAPPHTGAPSGRLRGGGSRGSCNWDASLPQLMALAPAYEIETVSAPIAPEFPAASLKIESVWSYTTQDRPTFWFYVPYELDETTEMLFILQDDEYNTLDTYTQTFQQSLNPGIMGVTLPDTAPPLDVGSRYRWSFQVYCDESPDFVDGWVYRIDPDERLSQQLQTATSQEQARLYASNGIWQDALMGLAQLRWNQPTDGDVAGDWRSLLESVGLDELVDQPFSHCCSAEPLTDDH